jgi:preprotein translocase subunit SecG
MMLALLVVHMMIAAALVGVVLIQKSEGGALGIGGGGGGGMMTGRGTANFLTRTTSMLGAAFFATSLALTLLAQHGGPKGSALDQVTGASAPAATAPATPGVPATPAAPADGAAPAAGAAAAPPAKTGGVLDDLQRGNLRLDR